MGPGLDGASGRFQLLGLHQLIRSVPDILCYGIKSITIGHLLGRLRTNLSSLLRRHIFWPCNGCRVLSHHHRLWVFLPAARGVHDLAMHEVLAVVSSPGTVYRFGKRSSVLPHTIFNVHIFFEEALFSHRDRRVRQCNRRSGVSGHRAATASKNRLPLDRPGPSLRHAGPPSRDPSLHPNETPTTTIRPAGRMGRLQRTPLPPLLNRHVPQLLGPILCLLLRPSPLLPSNPTHQPLTSPPPIPN